MLKKFLLTVLITAAALTAQAQNFDKAESLFQEGNFAAAQKEYEPLLQTATGNTLLQTQLRYAACQYSLGEYLNAAKTLLSFPLPTDAHWKARFLLYRIQMAKQASAVYNRILEEREIDDPAAAADPEQWTRAQWHRQILSDYETLWSLRTHLLEMPIANETLILNLKDTDTQRIPTLFDFVVQSYTDWLSSSPQITLPAAAPLTYLNGQATPAKETQNLAEKYASTLQTAYLLDGKNRANARVFWQTDFILLPLEKQHWFHLKDEAKARKQAIQELYTLSGFEATGKFWAKWKNFISPTDYGRAYAAYHAALLLQQADEREQALRVCEFATQLSKNYYTEQCQDLITTIQTPQFSFRAIPQALNPAAPVLPANAYNLPTVYGRIYTTSLAELKTFARTRGNNTLNRWNDLASLGNKNVQTLLQAKREYQTFSQPIRYQKPYTKQAISLALPALSNGLYIVAVSGDESFDSEKQPIYARVLNLTDVAAFTTAAIEDNPQQYIWTLASTPRTANPTVFRFYTVDLHTGKTIPQARLNVITDWKGTQKALTTNAQGRAALNGKIELGNQKSTSLFADVLAEKDGQYAFSASPVYFHFYTNEPVRLFAQTDRAVYRPAQTVHIALNAFSRTENGWEVYPNTPVTVTVKDPNYQTLFTAKLTTDALGSAQTKFTLPDDKPLLGNYDITLETTGSPRRNYHAYHSFRVEEYKRPDYELTLNDLETPLAYQKPATVRGQALYYTGAPLQNATVKYTVTKQGYIPPFYWWYFRPLAPAQQIAQGEVSTDNKGRFSLSFTPQTSQKDESFAQYRVQADVYDESGRPISTTRTYQISQKPLLFKASFNQGFFDADTPLTDFLSLDLTDANGTSAQGTVQVKIARLENQLPKLTDENSEGEYIPFRSSRPSLEKWYQNTAEEKTILTQTISFQKSAQQISAPALAEGIYRVTLSHPQADTQALIFVVAKDGSTLSLPAVALPQQTTYHAGETARILLGASALKGIKQAEIYQDNTFLLRAEELAGGVSVLEIPITPENRGGIAVSWFGTADYQFYQGSATLTVPFDNHELAVAWDVPPTVTPHQKITLNATVKGANTPVNGQASLTVYDASLDYYAKKQNPFALDTFYPQTARAADLQYSSLYSPLTVLSRIKQKYKNTEEPSLPSINLEMPRRMYKSFGRAVFGAPMMAASARAANTKLVALNDAVAESMDLDEAGSYSARGMNFAANESALLEENNDAPTLRTDFAETAYFNAQIPVTNGKAAASFTFPDSLTKWNLMGFVLTKDASLATYNLSTVSRKDFMVRLVLPRFYREGDKAIVQAAVTNLTDQKITVPVKISIFKNGKDAAADFGLKNLTKTVTVSPQGTSFATWDITAPHAPDMYQLTASARLKNSSDGEQKDFLILPATTRVLATVNRALEQGNTTLSLPELAQDSSAHAEVAALNLHPSLALSVLNSMPALLNNRYNDLISSLNRFVPLAVVNQFYNTYPELKEAVKKLPKRTTLTAPWNEKDPLRLTLLEQTPWLQLSRGGNVSADNILSLLDDKLVQTQLEKEQKNVAKFQNASGAFTWIAGGPDDDYLTLYALNSFAQALAYNAPVPTQMAQKAYSYIVPRIEQKLKQDKDGSVSAVSFALYAAYTLSAFPPEWAQTAQAKPYLKKWVDYADKQSRFMTPLGQIYAAAVYHRLGDDIKANAYLDKVLARLKENELTGAYFAPEAQSWVWYQDTLSTQTTTLRTLLEIRPQAAQIAPMLKWLLFNRQTNVWKSGKEAAQAVFTILDVMQAQGALSTPVSYGISWGGLTKKLTFAPFDWTKDLQFVKTGTEISPADFTATVSKQGGATDFASLSVVYTTANAKQSPKGVLNVSREYFVRFTQAGTQKLRPIKDLAEVAVGDEVEVHLTLTTDSAFEYIVLDDPKPAGFESEDLLSGWTYQNVSLYREVKDDTTRFFINRVPAGKITLRYVLRPTVTGQLHVLPAQVQSMYAPEYGAHTAADKLKVVK